MKPLFQSGQIESLVQDVAKNMLDRSEKWGVNRAVREAVVEVKRNVGYPQNPPVKYELGSTREEELAKRNKALAKVIQDGEERRRQMARILDTALGELGIPEAREDAVRRIAHVKECLLDDSIPLDKDLLQPAAALSPVASPKSKTRRRSVKADPRPPPVSPPGTFVRASFKNNSDPDFISLAQRPRATLAQSSFAWMLGDDLVSKHRSGFVAPSSSASQRKPSVDPLKGEDVITNGERREDEMGFDLGTFRKAEA